MILSKHKLPNGNSVIVYRGDSEDKANEGIAPADIISSSYDENSDVGILIISNEVVSTFEEVTEPLIKWMAENQHPHTTAQIDSISAQLWESKQSHRNEDYILD